MLPAFRSNTSIICFCLLLIGILASPVLLSWAGLPSREQTYKGITDEAGRVGVQTRQIFYDSGDSDVVLLGSSLVWKGINPEVLQEKLSAHLGRPAHITVLAMNWQGIDLQYFLLRDYLTRHKTSLVVWNLPAPGSRMFEPHIEANYWVRYGEYSDALRGLPLRMRLALYADMVLGVPRQLVAKLRPNQLSPQEFASDSWNNRLGYYGAPYVEDHLPSQTIPTKDVVVSSAEGPEIHISGPALDPYELHFAKKIVELLKEHHTDVVFLHVPIDLERNMKKMPELEDWSSVLGVDAPMLGISSAELFQGVSDKRFYHFYIDQHFNENGRELYTESIAPGLLKAYDQSRGSH